MILLKFSILLIAFVFSSVIGALEVSAQNRDEIPIPGTIFFDDQTYLHFEDIHFIHGYIAPTSRINRYKSFKIMYRNSIRVITLYSFKFLKINSYKPGVGQEGEQVLSNVNLRIETKNRQVFEMPYFELNWVQVEAIDEETGELIERRIPFINNNAPNIEKIIFD